jgi:hypothetical protein
VVDCVRVLPVVLEGFREPVVGESMEEAVLDEPQPTVVDLAQECRRPDDLVEHRLQTLGARHRVQYAAYGTLLFLRRFESASDVF